MSIRLPLSLAALAIASATPARAQSLPPLESYDTGGGTYEGQWNGSWRDGETWDGVWSGTYIAGNGERIAAHYRGTFHGDSAFYADDGQILLLDDERGWYEGDARHGPHRDYRDLPASPDGRLGYTLAERNAWLADCRMLMSDHYGDGTYARDYYRRGGNGPAVGAVLGAVAGGIAGNRIADGSRVGGTLLGAGLGGLAGAAIGSAVDGDDDTYRNDYAREDIYAARYCETYLRRYEMSGAGYGSMAYAQPMMVMRQPVHRHGPECRETVIEEYIDEDVAPPPAPRARRVIRREPRGKTTPIR
ncbi:glycine zipper 2TM domain-containing protein [Aurantiacibacter spongiae]|uniref:17 kDa surface antigen n=1 Tax=Aurantiacibacter spongiae TaxID=2488860 RepID=A0A3N5DKS0_9SPHN|nr:glycine zipper 2TM domain-containing protein [Aurantiacibacter spongiae]RPF71385.1 glycine zipper 2TM domain-containing protein [Aurantiacibacter spongiae]